MLSQGDKVRDIAQALYVSEHTVRSHLTSVYASSRSGRRLS